MTFLGMDPSSVTSVRDTFRRSRVGVRAAGRDLRSAVDRLSWSGDDADDFRAAGSAELGGQLLRLEGLLAALEHWVTAQVAEQRRTSGEL